MKDILLDIGNRLLQGILVLFVLVTITFFLTRALPFTWGMARVAAREAGGRRLFAVLGTARKQLTTNPL